MKVGAVVGCEADPEVDEELVAPDDELEFDADEAFDPASEDALVVELPVDEVLEPLEADELEPVEVDPLELAEAPELAVPLVD